jgi:hypothetical protein
MNRVIQCRRLPRVWLLLLFAPSAPVSGVGAQASPPQRYTVGGQDIFRLDLSSTAVGDFPGSIQMLDGIMDVFDWNGRRVLRASSRSTFLIQLPQVLPQDFSFEFEIVPKMRGVNPEDLAIEGTPTINQGPNSSNVMWHRDNLSIVGGGQTFYATVPPSFAATLPNMLTQVVIAMQGSTMKLYTNGRLMFTQTRTFARTRVLRVFLGGQDDGPNAVLLASLRVVNGVAVGPVVTAGSTTGGNAAAGVAGASPPPPPPAALPPNQLPNVGPSGGSNPGGVTNPPPTSGAISNPPPPPTGTAAATPTTGGSAAAAAGATGSGSVVSVAPGGRTMPTPMPAPFNNTSSLPNAPQPVQPPPTGSMTGASNAAPPAAGPALLSAVPAYAPPSSLISFGGMLAWTVVPGATSYRVYRGEVGKIAPVPVHLTVAATDAEAVGRAISGSAAVLAVVVDPYFDLATQRDAIYWVDATFANGSMSNLSPNATLSGRDALKGYDLFAGAPGPQNLSATVGPPMTMPGTLVPARNVTWTWDPTFLVLYEVDAFLTGQGAFGLGITSLKSETLLSAHGPFNPGTNSVIPEFRSPFTGMGYTSGPPYTVAVPIGSVVGFCVGASRTPGKPTTSAGRMTSCLVTHVP